MAQQPGPQTQRRWDATVLMAGRALFGGYFLYNGINHYVNWRALTEHARSKGVPRPGLAVATSGAMLLAGGVSILTGAWPKLGASLVSSFLLGVSPQMHAFWREQEPERQMDSLHFMKNMALLGASLFVAAQPEPWPWHLQLPRHRPEADGATGTDAAA